MFWFVIHAFPAMTSLAATMPMDGDFYKLLRPVLSSFALLLVGASCWIVGGFSWWAVPFGLIALVFNPFIPVYGGRDDWKPVNIVMAFIFMGHWIYTYLYF